MKKLLLAAATAAMMPVLAQAHFLLEYTEETMIAHPGEIPVKLVFWHPLEAGHVMALEKPEEFYVNKPVFEPLARNKVANQELFYRMMHSKIKDPSALDWSVKDPSIESSERGEFESLMTYKMKQW